MPRAGWWTLGGIGVATAIALSIYVSFHLLYPNSLEITNQSIYDAVSVRSLVLKAPKGGFLVTYRLLNTILPDSVIASSYYLFPDTYTNFRIFLSPEVNADTLSDTLLAGAVYEDTNENKVWDGPSIDKPLKTLLGQPVISVFRNTRLPEDFTETP